MQTPIDAELRDLLRRVRSIAVLGIKDGEGDDAFRVPRYMQAHGYRIVPINPKLDDGARRARAAPRSPSSRAASIS